MIFSSRPLLRFTLWVIALLPICFVTWWYFGALLTAPAVWLVNAVLTAWVPEVVQSVSLEGTTMTVLTLFGENNGAIQPAAQAGNQLAFPFDTRILSYSIPFFAALHFATPLEAALERFLQAVLVLWLLLAVGLLATALKDLMLGLGSVLLEQPGVPSANAIALAYQFCTLMIPPVTPVVIWAYMARQSSTFRELLSLSGSRGRPSRGTSRSSQGLPSQDE